MKRFKKICRKTQSELISYLVAVLSNYGYTVIQEAGFIYARGDIPVLLTAHMDTVHKEPVQDIVTMLVGDTYQISSPQGIGGDDRCGVYAILEIIKTHKPYILFCENEEVGCLGSLAFCNSSYIKELSKLKYLIGLDRANAHDAVFYQCDNDDFTKFIFNTTGYKETWGSYSDISKLAPKCKVAAVNLSCGYYNAHTTREYVVWEELLNTIDVVKDLLETECEQFEYIESVRSYYSGYYKNYTDYSRYNYYDSPRTSYNSYNQYLAQKEQEKTSYKDETYYYEGYNYVLLEVQFPSKYDTKYTATVHIQAKTKEAAWGKFFLENSHVCYDDILDYSWDYI